MSLPTYNRAIHEQYLTIDQYVYGYAYVWFEGERFYRGDPIHVRYYTCFGEHNGYYTFQQLRLEAVHKVITDPRRLLESRRVILRRNWDAMIAEHRKAGLLSAEPLVFKQQSPMVDVQTLELLIGKRSF